MENKYTKGPWLVEIFRELIGSIGGIYINDTTQRYIACVNDDGDNLDIETDLANAYLIAAAPELLEALIEAQQQLAVLKNRLTNEKQIFGVSATIDKSTIAINKALNIQS